ncbi:MAG: hypothetical protein AAGA37_10840 [Actinomycetota bacterium]
MFPWANPAVALPKRPDTKRLLALLVTFAVAAAACSDADVAISPNLSPDPVELERGPLVVVAPQVVAIDIDGDGVEFVELDGSESSDPDGNVVEYQWSNGFDVLARSSGFGQSFEVGEHVVTLTVIDDDGLADVQSTVVRVLEPYSATEDSPVIDLWVDADLDLGGSVAQRWVDLPGSVSDPDGLASLSYSLNGEPFRRLELGPDGRRLVRPGDFVVDILRSRLRTGVNTVEIRAVDNLGEMTTALVRLISQPDDDVVELPLVVDWSTQPLSGVVEIIDGRWRTGNGEAVLDDASDGYDRLLGIGDVAWEDYEVRTTVVVDSINLDRSSVSNTPGFGFLVRWNGHNDSVAPGSQPQAGFRPDGGLTPTPIGAFPFYTFDGDDGILEMQNHAGEVIDLDTEVQVREGVTYHLAAEVQSYSGGAVYRAKIWQEGLPEPSEWSVAYVAGRGQFEPQAGSVVLVSHEVATRWGTVEVRPVLSSARLSEVEVVRIRVGQNADE